MSFVKGIQYSTKFLKTNWQVFSVESRVVAGSHRLSRARPSVALLRPKNLCGFAQNLCEFAQKSADFLSADCVISGSRTWAIASCKVCGNYWLKASKLSRIMFACSQYNPRLLGLALLLFSRAQKGRLQTYSRTQGFSRSLLNRSRFQGGYRCTSKGPARSNRSAWPFLSCLFPPPSLLL